MKQQSPTRQPGTQNRPKKRLSDVLSMIAIILVLLTGVSLMLYPTVADGVNEWVNHGTITDYQKKVQALDPVAYEEMLDAARAYNAELFTRTPYIGELTQERRRVYESLLDVTGTGVMGYIEIEKLGIYLAIYHGTSDSVLQTGIGHLEASSFPIEGESVHTVLSGHSGLPSAKLFTDLDQLEIGDTFCIHVLNETLTYRVEQIQRVLPDTLKDLRIEEGQELCTLMTCTPYAVNSHRLVVTARRIDTLPSTSSGSQTVPTTTQALTSTWNWRYIVLPVTLFIALLMGIALFLRRRRGAPAGESRKGGR